MIGRETGMILCYANILCVDRDPVELASSLTSEEARALLLRAQEAVVVDDLRWGQASLVGTRFRQGGDDPRGLGIYRCIHLRAGASLGVAPAAGLGFAHEVGTMGDECGHMPRYKADERWLVEATAEYCRELHGLPVVAEVDALGECCEDFATSYRRRIAYALGFQASLRAGTCECYEARCGALVAGTVAAVDEAVRGRDELESFSLCLNLLAWLRRAIAHERRMAAPHPGAAGKVQARGDKLALLEGRLAEVSDLLERRMNADGRFAVRMLLRQLEAERSEGAWQVDISPLWGQGPAFRAPRT